jgi:hypothetical protein
MAINATSNGTKGELIPAGNYIARCYQMIHIGTVAEFILGEQKTMNKVRIGWELPTETRVFSQEKGDQPLVISKEFTLSMHEKGNLRKTLASWRGKDFSEDEAKSFDVTKLIGAPCMLNIIHKPSKKNASVIYEEIGSISPMPKGINCPAQINDTFLLDYDNFDAVKFDSLPGFIKTKMQGSKEFQAKNKSNEKAAGFYEEKRMIEEPVDDLPF